MSGLTGFHFGDARPTLHSRRVQVRIPCEITVKDQLLDALDATLGFPGYFGRNWDALSECLCDLSWLTPFQIVLVHGDLPLQGKPADARMYLSILRDAIAYWDGRSEHKLAVVFPTAYEAAIRALLVESVSRRR